MSRAVLVEIIEQHETQMSRTLHNVLDCLDEISKGLGEDFAEDPVAYTKATRQLRKMTETLRVASSETKFLLADSKAKILASRKRRRKK